MDARRITLIALLAFFFSVIVLPHAQAQTVDQTIYSDSLQNGWQNWSWAATNTNNTNPVHSGSDSISISAGAWQALSLHSNPIDTTSYVSLTFWINGGPAGGQRLQVQALLNGTAQTAYALPALAPNTWQQVTIPLSALGVAAQPNMDGFWIQDRTGTTQPTFYIDDITLVSKNRAIYIDSLQSGWQNWSWAPTNTGNTNPVHSGSDSISVSAGAWQAMFLHSNPIDTSPYVSLTFWINGGPSGGQRLQVQALLNGTAQTAYALPALAPNTWQQVTIPLSALGVAAQPNMDGFWIQDRTGTTQPTFYVDDITLVAPLFTTANVQVSAGSVTGKIDNRIYGLNTAIWDYQMSDPTAQTLLYAIRPQILRYPGGSAADVYDWSTDRSSGNTWQWPSSFAVFTRMMENVKSTAMITVNYGDGTMQEAAAWVAYANGSPSSNTVIGLDTMGRSWGTVGFWAALRASAPLANDDGYNFLRISHPAPFNIKYWEIGNECYGSWEYDQHGVAGSGLSGAPNDPYTYASYAKDFIRMMKSVDPSIKIGAVAVPGEDSWGDGQHAVVNPNENNSFHSGWTAVVLATMRAAGTLPDFLIHHRYIQNPGSESDAGLLQSGAGWTYDATNLRKMLTDYAGSAGAAIELDATETNSVSFNPGKQSTSLVNGLFFADNTASLAATEFRSCLWWDLRNGSASNNNNSSSLYGWRQFGDYGLLAAGDRGDTPANTPYPSYYAAKLLTHWGRGGDQMVASSCNNGLLSVHTARLQDGRLALLVINKDPVFDTDAQINLGSFVPGSNSATVYTYGKREDIANADLSQGVISNAAANFEYLFPSYSMTVIVLAAPVMTTPTALAPIGDTYVRGATYSSTNFGSDTILAVKNDTTAGSSFERAAYLQFDLSRITTVPTAAKLSLTLSGGVAGPATSTSWVKVYGIDNNNWTENTLTWNQALSSCGLTTNARDIGGTLAGALPVNCRQPGVYTWDLTSYLQSRIGHIVTLQVVTETPDGVYFTFNSKEAPAGKPTLLLSF